MSDRSSGPLYVFSRSISTARKKCTHRAQKTFATQSARCGLMRCSNFARQHTGSLSTDRAVGSLIGACTKDARAGDGVLLGWAWQPHQLFGSSISFDIRSKITVRALFPSRSAPLTICQQRCCASSAAAIANQPEEMDDRFIHWLAIVMLALLIVGIFLIH
jgi:hypothetical protein